MAPRNLRAASLVLHQASFDGGLYWSRPIVRLQLGTELRLDISLSHESVENTFENSTVSRWRIVGLETCIASNADGRIVWRSPTGQEACFAPPISPERQSVDSDGRKLTLLSPDEYAVSDNQSREWTYIRGLLTRVRLKNGDILTFECKNGLIRKINKGGNLLFQVRQIDSSLILYSGERRLAAISYNANGQLIKSVTFLDENHPSLEFAYENDNLRSISNGKERIYDFTWKKVTCVDRYYTTLVFPDYLYSDGVHKYQYLLLFDTTSLVAANKSGGWEKKTVNLKTGQIKDTTHGNPIK